MISLGELKQAVQQGPFAERTPSGEGLLSLTRRFLRMEELPVDVGTRVQWSNWSRCESSFSMLLVPHRPGVLVLAEEIMESVGSSKRMLALFFVCEARDLSAAVSAMFAAGSQLRSRLEVGRCYVRYSMISDPEHRKAVCTALRTWMAASGETASGIVKSSAGVDEADRWSAGYAQLPKVEGRAEVPARPDRNQMVVRQVLPAGF